MTASPEMLWCFSTCRNTLEPLGKVRSYKQALKAAAKSKAAR